MVKDSLLRMRSASLTCALAAHLVLGSMLSPAFAQGAYPTRTISLVVPSAPGNATDAVAREVAQALSTALKGQMVVENLGGAQGVVATNKVARAKADGYTLLMATNSALSAAPYVTERLPYDPKTDFTPVACIATGPLVLVVKGNSPIKRLPDLLAMAKEKPGTLSYGFQGTAPQVAGATFVKRAGIDVLAVPHPSASQAMQEVLAGRITFMFLDAKNAKPMVDAGEMRAIASATSVRSRLFPEVATLHEQGFPGFDVTGWFGIVAPAKLEPAAAAALQKALASSYFGQAAQNKVTSLGLDPCPTGSESKSFASFLQSDLVRWGEMLAIAGIGKK